MYNENEIVRKTYLLSNIAIMSTEKTTLNDGTLAELIDMDNFTLVEIPVKEIKEGQWFIFVEPTECCEVPCLSVGKGGDFLYLCVKNNQNGSVDVKTTFIDFEKKIEVIGKINNMLEEKYKNETAVN